MTFWVPGNVPGWEVRRMGNTMVLPGTTAPVGNTVLRVGLCVSNWTYGNTKQTMPCTNLLSAHLHQSQQRRTHPQVCLCAPGGHWNV